MFKTISTWYQRHFSDSAMLVLWLAIIAVITVFWLVGHMLAPVIASVIIAYLLDGMMERLKKLGCPHLVAVSTVFVIFLGVVLVAFLGLVPLLWQQMLHLYSEIPHMLTLAQHHLAQLPTQYPDFVTQAQLKTMVATFREDLTHYGQVLVGFSVASIPGLITLVVYLVLVPLLVFFFLLDKGTLLTGIKKFLPEEKRLLLRVWSEINVQIGNYVRGKLIEVVIVAIVTVIAFLAMGLQYALLLGALVGLSVIIPYIGAVIVTIPVAIIALLQWGWSSHFAYLMAIYAIIITVDANILVPLLFSEAVDLHPVSIIIAVLIFGGLFGFWGVFFAIPLATVVKAILMVWESPQKGLEEGSPV